MKGNWKFLFMSIIGLFMIGLSYGQVNDDQAAIDEQVTNLEQNVEPSEEVMSELEQEETVEDVITAEPIGEHSKEAVAGEGHNSHGHEGMNTLDLIALLVLLAALFTFINIHYIKLPGTIGLMLQALFLSLIIV
jgi:hypothetical protein